MAELAQVQTIVEELLDEEDDDDDAEALTRPPELAPISLINLAGSVAQPLVEEPATGVGYEGYANVPQPDGGGEDDAIVTGSGRETNEAGGEANAVVTGSGREADEAADPPFPTTGTGVETDEAVETNPEVTGSGREIEEPDRIDETSVTGAGREVADEEADRFGREP